MTSTMMPAASAADAKSMFDKKVRSGIFQPVARHLREDLVEDRLAEGIGLTFQMYAKSVAEDRPMDDALLVHACRLRAIDLGRRVAGSQGARAAGDVYNEHHYREGRLELLRLDGLFDDSDDEQQGLIGWADAMANNPSNKIVSAIDLERWLSTLDAGDRLLLALRRAGHTLAEISLVTGLASLSAICHRLRELGEELALQMGVQMGTTS